MSRRLTRSRTDTILGGVAAGVADYLHTDPALVRIAWAILVPLTNGAALLAYVVAWIVVPESPALASDAEPGSDQVDAAAAENGTERPNDLEGRAGIVVGIGLVLLGAWFLARDYLPAFNWNLVWPLVLVGIGVLILVSSARRRAQ